MPRLGRRRLDVPLPRCSRELGYRVSALHVDHGLRGAESDEDARFVRRALRRRGRASARPRRATEAALRDVRYSFRADALRATGHTPSDQVETILYRLVSRGDDERDRGRGATTASCGRCSAVWREETEAFCRERGLDWRTDSSNRRHDARPDPRRDPAAPRAAPSGRAREPPARARRAAHAAAGARRAARARRSARSASTSAAGCRRCASTSGSGSSAGRSTSPARSSGAPGGSSPSCQGSSTRLEARRPARRPEEEGPGCVRRREDPALRSRRRGRSSCAATRSSRCPGIVEAEGVSATRVAD